MLKAIEGIFRNGRVELLEPPPLTGDARVLVTFLPSHDPVDLSQRNIDPAQAKALLARLRTFAEDGDRPDMDVYDEV